jgi:alkanesulfonate monooxygenase SsuD/methylene tetrahydromethanopterin reductase-like flavin-dependent oxidoreductase (luciferase family)
LDSLARDKAAVAKLHRLTAEAGRDPARVGLALRVQKFGAELPALAGDGERHLFSGSAAQIVEDIHALRALGVSAIDFNFLGSTAEKVLAQMESFRTSVMERI